MACLGLSSHSVRRSCINIPHFERVCPHKLGAFFCDASTQGIQPRALPQPQLPLHDIIKQVAPSRMGFSLEPWEQRMLEDLFCEAFQLDLIQLGESTADLLLEKRLWIRTRNLHLNILRILPGSGILHRWECLC